MTLMKEEKQMLTNEEIDYLLSSVIIYEQTTKPANIKNRTFSDEFVDGLKEKLKSMYKL